MNSENARILILGAGVNGSICAAGLQRAGLDVTVLARGKRYDDIREQGIILEDVLKNTRSVTRVPAIHELQPDDRYDYIFVVVRKNQVPDVLPVLAANASPNVVFMVNNPSGPEEWIRALGKERLLQGFVFGAGRREGSVIRGIIGLGSNSSLAGRLSATPFGELEGSITPRLTRLVNIFRQAGFAATASRDVTDHLATHAALVALLADFAIQRGFDRESIGRYTSADYSLLADGMRGVLDVLSADGIRITPPNTAMIKYIPRWLLVALFRAVFPSKFMEVGGVYHISQAPDEMAQLAKELRVLVDRSGLPVPSVRKILGMNPPEKSSG
jgi:2-dehydropantoate 2-reductase